MALKVGELFASFNIDASGMETTLGRIMTTCQGIGKTLITLGIVKAVKDSFGHVINASVDFESAMAGVAKTVNPTAEQLEALQDAIKEMGVEVPKSTSELAGIMEMGGQLAVPIQYLESFTKVVSALSASTDLTSEAAAKMFAQFANITGMSYADYENLGSTLVDLGNNSATSESAIMEMAMRIAAAGTQLGMSVPEILGVSASLASVGINAEAGGTAFSKLMINMSASAENGSAAFETLNELSTDWTLMKFMKGINPEQFDTFAGKLGMTADEADDLIAKSGGFRDFAESVGYSAEEMQALIGLSFPDTARNLIMLKDFDGASFKDVAHGIGMTGDELKDLCESATNLEKFSQTAGMTTEEFSALVKSDPTAAMQAFIGGLNKIKDDGGSALQVLEDMGIKEVRLRDTILRATNSADLLADAVERGNTAWEANVALAKEAATRYATTESNTITLETAFNNLCISIGDKLTPAVNTVADGAKTVLTWLTDVIDNLGKTTLNAQDVKDVVDTFVMPETWKMEDLAIAQTNSDSLLTSMTKLDENINKLSLMATLKTGLTAQSAVEFQTAVNTMIETGLRFIEAQEYETKLTLKTVMGEGENYDAVSQGLFKPFFAAIKAEAEATGEAARAALVSAMADGTITPEEAAKIKILAQQYTDAVAQAMADAELKGRILQIQAENVGGTLDSESIKDIVKSVRNSVQTAADTLTDAKSRTVTLAYQAAATLSLAPDAAKKYVATIENEMRDKMAAIRLEGANNVLNVLSDTITLPNPESIFAGMKKALEYGVTGIGVAVSDTFSTEMMDNAMNIFNALKPDKEKLEALRSEYEEAGQEIPKGITDALNRISLIEAIANGDVGIGDWLEKVFGEGVNSAEFFTQENASMILAELARVLYTDAEIPNAASAMWDKAFSTSLAGLSAWKDQLEIQFRAMGITAGTLMGAAIPENVIAGLKDGSMSIADAASEMLAAAMGTGTPAATQVNAVASEAAAGLEAGTPEVAAAADTMTAEAKAPIATLPEAAAEASASAALGMASGMLANEGVVQGAMDTVANDAVVAVLQKMSNETGKTLGADYVGGIQAGITGGQAGVSTAANAMAESARLSAESVLQSRAFGIGAMFAAGIAIGIRSGMASVRAASSDVAQGAVDASTTLLDINSPSRIARDRIGAMYVAGIAEGLTRNTSMVRRAASDVTNAMHGTFMVGDPSRGTVYTSRATIQGTAQEAERIRMGESGRGGRASVRAEDLANAVVTALMGVGVYIDGERAGELVAASVSNAQGRSLRALERSGLGG